jgi:hypothetical protein
LAGDVATLNLSGGVQARSAHSTSGGVQARSAHSTTVHAGMLIFPL